jgi:GNAT superfamily N-acetyltransferase
VTLNLAHVADLWEENQECLKQRLGQSDSDRFGARWVLMPEAPFPRFNHASRIRIPATEVDDLVAAARTYFRGQGLPICAFMVTPATEPFDLGPRLYRMGFTSETNPVMLWGGTPVDPPNKAVRVELAPPEQSALVFGLLRRVFFPHSTDQTLETGRRGVTVSYAIGARNYVAYLGNRPVGAGMLFCRGGMGGIYNMCTMPECRGRGVATAILARILADAPALGCSYVGLTPTSMGRPLYERLGFLEIYQERYFVQRFEETIF